MITKSKKQKVYQKFVGHCAYCGKPLFLGTFDCTIDHIIPRSVGGTSDFSNLALSCYECNTQKSSLTLEEFRKKLGHDFYFDGFKKNKERLEGIERIESELNSSHKPFLTDLPILDRQKELMELKAEANRMYLALSSLKTAYCYLADDEYTLYFTLMILRECRMFQRQLTDILGNLGTRNLKDEIL